MKLAIIRLWSTALIVLACTRGAVAVTPAQAEGKKDAEPAPILTLPTVFDDYRFFVVPETYAQAKLPFLTSTGDKSLIYSDVVFELRVPVLSDSGKSSVMLPPLDPKWAVPVPRGNRGQLPIVSHRYRRPYLTGQHFGILGETWFADRVWTLDYPGHIMQVRPIGDLPNVPEKHKTSLGFARDNVGLRENNLPTIRVVIGGESFWMLLNTGATAILTDEAVKTLGDKRPPIRAMSFIIQSQFDAWKTKHKWRVVENAEKKGAPIIEVPKITIGGYEVGPVWFMARPDEYYRVTVSRSVDRTVAGAVGGNALRFFRVTLDYPESTALFEKP